MKIMFYNDDVSVSSGGTERIITQLATSFSNDGYDCVLLTYTKGKVEYPIGADVRRNIIGDKSLKKGIVRKLEIVRGIRFYVKCEHPDVLITMGVGMIHRALFATIGLPVKNIISYQCSPYWDFRSRFNHILMKTLHQRTDGLVSITQEAWDFLPKRMQRKGTIIFNSVSDDFFCEEYNGPRKDIVSVGRLKGMKNHRMLINAYARIADKIDDKLLIYGDGPLKDEIQLQIQQLHLEKRVILKGICTDLPNVIKSAKLFVMSSDHEGGGPNTLMEAMALGIPCVSTNCIGGGPKQLFGEIMKDFLVPTNDVDSMSKKMLEVLSNPELQEWMSRVERELVSKYRPVMIYSQWKSYVLHIVNNG